MTTQEVASRFNELAQQEKWFEIQDELFADVVTSTEPGTFAPLRSANGKTDVRKKGEEWVKGIEAAHARSTTLPLVMGNHFAVGRSVDITTQKYGRLKFDQIMMYEVRDGKIVSEQFFY